MSDHLRETICILEDEIDRQSASIDATNRDYVEDMKEANKLINDLWHFIENGEDEYNGGFFKLRERVRDRQK